MHPDVVENVTQGVLVLLRKTSIQNEHMLHSQYLIRSISIVGSVWNAILIVYWGEQNLEKVTRVGFRF